MSDKEVELTTPEEESSTSEEEDEDGKEWTEEIEKTFLKTLSSLKRKDPKIYDTSVNFFNNESEKDQEAQQPSASSSEKSTKEKPLYLRDYERKIILEKGGMLSDEESDLSDDEEGRKRAASPTYVEEQEALKNNFKKLLTDSDESDTEDHTAGFLKLKVKNEAEKATEEAEYVEWLKGHKSELSDKEFEEDLQYLRDYWTDPNLNEGEQFLRDYVLNKKFLEENNENRFESELSFSEEEKLLNDCEEYEHKYNFRFEEPDQDFIKTYPRVIEDSLRRRDDKRKRKREERKQRKEETMNQKRLEVKRLQKQKREELMEKINKLKELTGNKTLGFNDDELERDFDASEFDGKMKKIFNDEFYQMEADLDPDFDANENEDYSEDFNMDCDYDPEATHESKFKKQTRSSRRKGHKKTTFAEAVQKEKPIFDPTDKTYEEYLNEYYGLDFEDIIDDMPCRFKYRNVTPNDFGLSVEEILAADDKELNKWCSIKKIDTIRPEHNENFDKKIYQKRARNVELKKKFLPSLFDNVDTAEQKDSSLTEISKKKKKKRGGRKRPTQEEKVNQEQKESVGVREQNSVNEKCRKRKAKHQSEELPAIKKIKSESFENEESKNISSVPAIKKIKSESFENEESKNISSDSLGNPKSGKDFNKRRFKNSAKGSKSVEGTNKRTSKFQHSSKNFKSDKNTNKRAHKFSKNSTKNSKYEEDAAENNFVISDERLKAYGFNPKKYKNKIKYGKSLP